MGKIFDSISPLSLSDGLSLDENLGDLDIDGTYILGKIKGEMFVPDGVSRNGRFYKRSLWEGVCSDLRVKQKLRDRNMYSTVSHEIPYDDTTLQEGKYSHIITNLYIDENGKGIGEALILGTPAGKILHTYLKAGCTMYSSTRADGGFMESETYNGLPVVDPSSFYLEGIDIVQEPGFLQSRPKLVESLNRELKKEYEHMGWKSTTPTLLGHFSESSDINHKNNKENTMSNLNGEVTERLSREALEARTKMNEALEEVAKTQSENHILNEELKSLREESKEHRAAIKKIAVYESIGTPEEIKAAFDAVDDLKDELETAKKAASEIETELGSAEEIKAALSAAEEVSDQIEKIISEFGSAEEIRDALSSAEEFISSVEADEEEIGSPDEVREALSLSKKIIESYLVLGTPSSIKEVFSKFNILINEKKSDNINSRAKRISESYGLPIAPVAKMIAGGMSESEITSFYKDISESKGRPAGKTSIRENVKKRNLLDVGDRALNLMESFSGK